ncbi:MAG: MATE family efflux transporter [Eubacterium sp.]|nr:MATE family efflux transporter [Eubacterium sp.]
MEVQKRNEVFYTRKQLAGLIWPLLLEQLLAVTMGLADTFMVSSVSEAAVSSVSLVDTLNVLVFQVLSALASGGAVVVSQYMGQKNYRQMRKCSAQLYSVLLIGTSVVMLAAIAGGKSALRLIFGSIDASVMQNAQIYFFISALSYPFMGAYNAGAALFRAQGNSKVSMKASLVMNVMNILGNALLIYGLQMGVLGAALATLAGRIFSAVWVTMQQQKKDNPYRIERLADLRPNREQIRPILVIGIPSGLENGMFQIGKLCVSSLTATLGTSAIAANAVANTVATVANIPGNTIGLAVIPVIGRCLGAGDKEQAKRYARLLLAIAVAGLAVMNAAVFVSIPAVAQAYHLTREAKRMCVSVIRLFCVFSVFFWALSFTLPQVLRSGGDAKFTMSISVLSMWIFRVVLSYFFVLKMDMGLMGVWLGMCIDWICRSIFFTVRFWGGKWMEHRVI